MADSQILKPAAQMAATNTAHFPNESAAYRAARNALLAEEIELRRHVERVAAQRRELPVANLRRAADLKSPSVLPPAARLGLTCCRPHALARSSG